MSDLFGKSEKENKHILTFYFFSCEDPSYRILKCKQIESQTISNWEN